MQPSLEAITRALRESWDRDTAYDSTDWSTNNKARGQCVVSSLVVQDYFGGDLIGYEINDTTLRETHFMNKLDDGTIIDVTASQYTTSVNMRLKSINLDGFKSVREKRLADKSTADRYELLKQRVAAHLSAH